VELLLLATEVGWDEGLAPKLALFASTQPQPFSTTSSTYSSSLCLVTGCGAGGGSLGERIRISMCVHGNLFIRSLRGVFSLNTPVLITHA